MLSKKEKIISLIGNAVFSIPLPDNFPKEISSEEALVLFQAAQRHDLAHIVAFAIKRNEISIPTEIESKFQKQLFMSAYRTEKLQYELKRLSKILEKEKIPFVPLKGSVLRSYYPEPWMRTSCDIDLLVREEDLDRVTEAVIKRAGYNAGGQWNGERSFFSPDGIHLEIHFYDEADKEEGVIFREIWEHVSPCEENLYCMQIEWEYFYAHHMIHMAKHFAHGGCGIRSFLDLALIQKEISINFEIKTEYLKRIGLFTFSAAAERLSAVWFGEEEHTTLTEQIQEYLLGAGIFGSIENQVALERSGNSRHLKGFWSHVWLPYDVIKHQFPIVFKFKWLVPFCQIVRWFKLIFCGGIQHSLEHLRENKNISDEKVKQVSDLIEQLELK